MPDRRSGVVSLEFDPQQLIIGETDIREGMTPSEPKLARDARMRGKTVVVTGANSGIGLEAAVAIAAMGARVLMVARSRERGERGLEDVRQRTGSDGLSLLVCDMSSMADVRRLAAAIGAAVPRLDVLVNNAGSVNRERDVTEEGFERTFAANYLGHFLLTTLLLPLLTASAPSRIVNVSSVAHRQGRIDFDNLQYEKGGYGIMAAYSRSKLAQVLFTHELSRRLEGTGVTVNSLHPGAVATNIWSHAGGLAGLLLAPARLFMLGPKGGADTIVYLATNPQVEGHSGGYYEKRRRLEPSVSSRDTALARRLWEISDQLTAS